MPRLFVGSFLLPAQQDELYRLSQKECLPEELKPGSWRWVKPEKLHLTWFFLSQVEQADLPKLKEVLQSALSGQRPISICYEQAEFFPSAGQPRQLVLSPLVIPPPVQRLSRIIRDSLAPLVAQPDCRAFRPHITLLRLNLGCATPEGYLALPESLPLNTVLPLKQDITEIALIQSHLGREAQQYQRLATFVLGR